MDDESRRTASVHLADLPLDERTLKNRYSFIERCLVSE